MFSLPQHPRKVDPDTLIRKIEDDPLSQMVWDSDRWLSRIIRQLTRTINDWVSALMDAIASNRKVTFETPRHRKIRKEL